MSYQPLPKPLALSQHNWPAGTQPVVQTSTLAYNHEKYIRNCLDGILMQETTFPVEALVHDDASTDSTTEIIREYEARYPHVIKAIYQKENQYKKPLRKQMRKDILAARRGKYIAMCEGDDYWTDPQKLQIQVDFLETHPDYVMCSHEVKTVWLDGIEEQDVFVEPLESAGFEEILKQGLYIPTPSIVYLREFDPVLIDWFYKLWAGHWPAIMLITTHGKNYHFMRSMATKQKNAGGITQDPAWRRATRKNKLKQKIFLYKQVDAYSEKKYHPALVAETAKLYRRQGGRSLRRFNLIGGSFSLLCWGWYKWQSRWSS